MECFNECEGAQRRESEGGKRMEMMEWGGTDVEISVDRRWARVHTSAERLEAFPGPAPCSTPIIH